MVLYLNTGYTAAKHYDKLGTITYGFVPMLNDPQEPIARLIHGKNERIGVDVFGWGCGSITGSGSKILRPRKMEKIV